MNNPLITLVALGLCVVGTPANAQDIYINLNDGTSVCGDGVNELAVPDEASSGTRVGYVYKSTLRLEANAVAIPILSLNRGLSACTIVLDEAERELDQATDEAVLLIDDLAVTVEALSAVSDELAAVYAGRDALYNDGVVEWPRPPCADADADGLPDYLDADEDADSTRG